MPLSGSSSRNHLPVASTPGDLGLLMPYLSLVALPLRRVVEQPGRTIDHIYFFLRGMASVIAVGAPGRIEFGIIGREGMSGLSVVLGDLIQAARGSIRIVDRAGLIEHTDGFYGVPEVEYDRLITNAAAPVQIAPLTGW
jgi:hypothetical protein